MLAIPFVGAVTFGLLFAIRALHIWTSGEARLPTGALLYFGSFFSLAALLTLIPQYWRWQTGRRVRSYRRLEPLARRLDPGATGPHDTLPTWRAVVASALRSLVARAEGRRDSRLAQLREATYIGTAGLTILVYALLR